MVANLRVGIERRQVHDGSLPVPPAYFLKRPRAIISSIPKRGALIFPTAFLLGYRALLLGS
ncbi:MAG: hypothetical protein ACXWUF_00795 [Methylomagnum sp.]